MKKLTKLVAYGVCGVMGMAMMGVSMWTESVGAACAYVWEFLDEERKDESVIMCYGASEDGAFASQIEEDYVVRLKLNDYNGGAFDLKGYGTGIPIPKIIVELYGENVIDAGDGVAFDFGMPVEFTGNGTLKIRAAVPFLKNDFYIVDGEQVSAAEILKKYRSSNWTEEEYMAEVVINPSASGSSNEVVADNSGVDEGGMDSIVKCPTVEEKDDFGLIAHVIGGVYIVGSLVAFGVLGVRHFMRKKSEALDSSAEKPKTPGLQA